MNLNSDSQKWWEMISGGKQPSASPFNDLMGGQQQAVSPAAGMGGGLSQWLSQPRQPGQSSAQQMPPPPTYTPPAPAQTPNGSGGTDAPSILRAGYGYHPKMGFVSLTPDQKMQAESMQKASTPRIPTDELLLWHLMNPNNLVFGPGAAAGAQAQGESGVAGNGPSGTDGGIY